MLFTSMSQLVVLVVLFFGGLMLGLGLHPGGKKWRKRFTDESANYTKFRHDADARLRDADARLHDADTRLRDADQRIATLERENAEPARHVPGSAPQTEPVAPPVATAAVPAPFTSGDAPSR